MIREVLNTIVGFVLHGSFAIVALVAVTVAAADLRRDRDDQR